MKVVNSRRLLAGAALVVLVAAGGATAVFDISTGAKAGPSAAAAAPSAIPVSVATVKASAVRTWQEFSGRLEAVDMVDLRSRVAGAIQSVNFREGSLINKGDVLVTIDPAGYQAAVDKAKAEVSSAAARVELAKVQLDRSRRLVASRTVSQSDLDQRTSDYHEAIASLQSAKASLQSAELDLGYTQIRAPISGRIGKFEITPGNLVAAGASSPILTTIVSVDPIYASFDVDEHAVARALAQLPSTGSGARPIRDIPVEIAVDGDKTPITGHLQFIANRVDTASGTVHVRAVFANRDGRLLPGQFVRVRMGQPKPRPQVLVSDRAIGTDQDKKFVLLVGADDKLAYRQVELGDWADGLRIVTSGLKPGDRIVVDGLQRVRPGAVVAPQPVAMASIETSSASTDLAER